MRNSRKPGQRFFPSRVSLAAGIACVGIGTVGAGVWALTTTAPDRSLDGGTVTAAAPPPPVLAQTLPAAFTFPGAKPQPEWPKQGSAVVEVQGIGVLGSLGSMTAQVPIASITKTMVAFLILKDHPLAADAQGPTIVLTPEMAAQYGAAIAHGESSVDVSDGEHITERQALEALMLASAGDMADILAIWDGGSIDAFLREMNQEAAKLGMTGTRYTDPTGLDASTVSTMADQLKLAEQVEQVPALTSIVDEQSADIPVQGEVVNYNKRLGVDGIDGIKTGTTAAAGSCLLFSAHYTVGGRTVTILGMVLGQPGDSGTPWAALDDAVALVGGVEQALGTATVAAPGARVAAIDQGGVQVGALGVKAALTVVGWPGLAYRVKVGGTPAAASVTVTQTGGSDAPSTAALSALPKHGAAGAIPKTAAGSATPANE